MYYFNIFNDVTGFMIETPNTNFQNIYSQIRFEFGYPLLKDYISAIILNQLIKNPVTIEKLQMKIQDKDCYIYGFSVNLEEEIERSETSKGSEDNILRIATDASVVVLKRFNIIPDIIVTDLDGDVNTQIEFNKRKSIVVIHAHGDNISKIIDYVPRFTGDILGTVQVKPFDKVHNLGGFTDGDRAYCIAKHFDAKRIFLIGFDFDNPRVKPGTDLILKKKKLVWARRIVESWNSSSQ